jgi:hypothetical protein
MLTVYKYIVPLEDAPKIEMPSDAKVLSFGVQNEELFIWAMVETGNLSEWKEFVLLTTGSEAQAASGLEFVGTAMLRSGSFVVHLFQK